MHCAKSGRRLPGGAHMVSGVQQGRLLHTLVRLSRAQRVLEVGCFTGYAALWMALGLPEDGTLLSLERDERCAGNRAAAFRIGGRRFTRRIANGRRVRVARGHTTRQPPTV